MNESVEVSPLREVFLTMHEMFVEAVAAGFSRYEAAILIGSFLACSGQGGAAEGTGG